MLTVLILSLSKQCFTNNFSAVHKIVCPVIHTASDTSATSEEHISDIGLQCLFLSLEGTQVVHPQAVLEVFQQRPNRGWPQHC